MKAPQSPRPQSEGERLAEHVLEDDRLFEEQKREVEGQLREISQKILANLEENWEINQTIHELRDLRHQNEKNLDVKRKRLEKLNNGSLVGSSEEIKRQAEEIDSLGGIMDNNERILDEMEKALSKNQEDKKSLYNNMLKL